MTRCVPSILRGECYDVELPAVKQNFFNSVRPMAMGSAEGEGGGERGEEGERLKGLVDEVVQAQQSNVRGFLSLRSEQEG